jgi:hypothetical protein
MFRKITGTQKNKNFGNEIKIFIKNKKLKYLKKYNYCNYYLNRPTGQEGFLSYC